MPRIIFLICTFDDLLQQEMELAKCDQEVRELTRISSDDEDELIKLREEVVVSVTLFASLN